jgi:hypothetical protein
MHIKRVLALQENGIFAAFLEAFCGGFKSTQNTIATVYKLT